MPDLWGFFLNLKPKDRNRSHNLNSLPWLLKLQSLICLSCLIGRFDLIGGIGSWMKSYQASMCAMKKVQSTTVSKPPWRYARRIQIRGLMKYTPDFLTLYHFMFNFMSSLVTWDVVILVLIILKTHVWLRDF